MPHRCVGLAMGMESLATFFLLMAPAAQAGDRVLSTERPAIRPQAPIVSSDHLNKRLEAISLAVSVARPVPTEAVSVELVGPDGQKRRFSVEGGRDAIVYQQVVLHPGQSVTIHWMAAK
jgi:hypothetical protein